MPHTLLLPGASSTDTPPLTPPSSRAGRLAALQRKLSDLASFEFVDAPHPLPPFLLRPLPPDAPGRLPPEADPFGLGFAPPEQWVRPEAAPQRSAAPGRSSAQWAPKRAWVVAPSDLEWGRQWRERQESGRAENGRDEGARGAAPKGACSAARAARSAEYTQGVSPAQHSKEAEEPRADGTYRGQTEGWAESLSVILSALRGADPPFDGLLGFSQGAGAVAAAAAEALRLQASEGGGRRWAPHFVWACSGYPLSPLALGRGGGGGGGGDSAAIISLPSLHVFGGADGATPGCRDAAAGDAVEGGDWQVSAAQSEALLRLFCPPPGGSSSFAKAAAEEERHGQQGRDTSARPVVVRHAGGHFVPADDAAVERFRAFLEAQMQR